MSKFLSDCLAANEPYFRNDLRHFESVSGHPSADIRTAIEVEQGARSKLSELGLEAENISPEELYYILKEKLKLADQELVKSLRMTAASKVSAEANLVDGIAEVLAKQVKGSRAFVIKPSVVKLILKDNAPKQAVKKLGYRSLDSFIKREPTSQILLAAKLYEGQLWQKKYHDQIGRLKASDFEEQPITINKPDTKRWQMLSKEIVNRKRRSIVTINEIGAILLLPLPEQLTSGMTIANLGIALIDEAQLKYNSSLLKLAQVRKNFGKIAADVFEGKTDLQSNVLEQSLPWNLIHQHLADSKETAERLSVPHFNLASIKWHSVEDSLCEIIDDLSFWKDTAFVAYLRDNRPVSFNILDVAVNCANDLDYKSRSSIYFAESLWQRLMSKYLTPAIVEQTIVSNLEPNMRRQGPNNG